MNVYELLFIYDPRIPEEDSAALKDRITGLITGNGGEVVLEDDWGGRRMAYPIRKLEDGHYFRLLFKSAPSFVSVLDRQLRLLQNVVRFMIVREGE